MRPAVRLLFVSCAIVIAACGASPPSDAGDSRDASDDRNDARTDVRADVLATDVTGPEVGDVTTDTTRFDAAPTDALADATVIDSNPTDAIDARQDTGVAADTGATDTGRSDTATGGCVSGASGSRAVRFRWEGSGAGSTAYVRYEANELPDTSRWRVTANSRSIGYTPVFDDPFLGVGGLDLEGTGFIDVELSTAGLGPIRGVTISIFGRSFNTTASGSFSWQTFTGVGAAPTNLVSNVAPYRWYGADATTEFVPGDARVLLRLYPGPSSNALIVNRVEVCFDGG